MLSRSKNLLFSKAHSAILIVVLCFSVLGVQSFGLFHAVHHANQEQHLQANGVFDSIEKGFSSDPQKSNLTCKLLDSLLLGASVASQQISPSFSDFDSLVFLPVLTANLALLRLWSYQSQAPPQSNSQY
jgi:hypothetical protein